MATACGTFEVELTPEASELGGAASRFRLAKTWHGDLSGDGSGVMLSGGDPQSGAAGYVAIERFEGRLGGHVGGFAFQQFGLMQDGGQRLEYVVVPGSGTGELAGITGALELNVDPDGTHRYALVYSL